MSLCKTCAREDRQAIDAQILQGTPLRAIAARFGLSAPGLVRHKRHIREDLKAAARAESSERTSERGSDLLNRIEEVIKGAKAIAAVAVRSDDLRTGNNALRTVLSSLELIAKLTGELQTPGAGIHFHNTKNVMNVVTVNDNDVEVAELVREATDGWNLASIERLKLLAPAQSTSEAQPDLPSRDAKDADSTRTV